MEILRGSSPWIMPLLPLGSAMLDFLLLATGLGVFALLVGYVAACERV